MHDLISRQQAIEIVERYNKSHMVLKQQPMLGAASIVIELEELPSVQPEIIRCKDCKCWHPQFKTENGNGLGSCDFHDVALVTSKGFCYWAERKEDDQRRSD